MLVLATAVLVARCNASFRATSAETDQRSTPAACNQGACDELTKGPQNPKDRKVLNNGVTSKPTSTPTPPDTVSPEAVGSVQITAATASSLRVSWPKASDDTTPASELEYDVFVVESGQFDLEDDSALSLATPQVSVTGVTTADVPDLTANKTYDAQVRVRDAAGNVALYASATLDLKVGFPWLGARAGAIDWFSSNTAAAKPMHADLSRGSNQESAVSGDFFYYADETRIFKVNRITGQLVGWLGEIGETLPTGGNSACITAASGTYTPGWCTGGSAGSTLTSIAGALATDGSFLYSVNKHWIVKINLTSGAVVGWIGKIATKPTGGDAGCTNAAVGDFTPGWCRGGTPDAGTQEYIGDGRIGTVYGIHLRSDGYLYIAGIYMLRRYAVASGTFGGWIGVVDQVPTGGHVDCPDSAFDELTPGWCIGGGARSTLNTGNREVGSFVANGITDVTSDDTYLYLLDSYYSSVVRVAAASGIGQGWIGKIGNHVSYKPTGGGAGCTTVAQGAWTPDWCQGGHPDTKGNGFGPMALVYDTNHLYLGEPGKLHKVATSNGAYLGWSGFVADTPTGGGAGCTTLARGQHTTNWCTGGTAGPSDLGYQFGGGPITDAGDNTLYVFSSMHDSSINSRQWGVTARYDIATGSFTGWLGTQAMLTTGWNHTGEPVYAKFNGGGLYRPQAIASDETYLYVLQAGKIDRFDRVDGSHAGWIGIIEGIPSGGASGCTTAAKGDFTPGWCTGGTSQIFTGAFSSHRGNIQFATDIAVGKDAIYVVEYLYDRVSKYNIQTGQFVGWIGTLDNTAGKPTAGVAGCLTMGYGAQTPGWCIGGYSKVDITMFFGPKLIALDKSTAPETLYVVGGGPGDVLKFNAETGARLSTVSLPTSFGINDAIFAANGYLYHAKPNAIEKLNLTTQASEGWIGTVEIQPTGGGAGCRDAQPGDYTPHWCTGGSARNSEDGAVFDNIFNLGISDHDTDAFLYVADAQSRVIKISLEDGAWIGWQGYIDTAPTGGADGCAGRGRGLHTPGWCLGGKALADELMFPKTSANYMGNPVAFLDIASDNTVYILDGLRGRVVRLD